VRLPSNKLVSHYANLEENYQVNSNSDYGSLVVPNGNSEEAFHRWFHVKEGFSSQILGRVLEDTDLLRKPQLTLLDPFVGGGTTIVSALLLGKKNYSVRAYGIECNPFLKFVAQTKINAIRGKKGEFRKFIQNVINNVKSEKKNYYRIPELSTFNNSKYFNREQLEQLARLKLAIEMTDGLKSEKDIAMLCLAGIIEPASYLRKDGRALRYVPDKNKANVINEFLKRAEKMAYDLDKPCEPSNLGIVYLGDGRHPQNVLPKNLKFDLIFFSPPYPNNIDYTEVYKLEAWFLDFINDESSFRNQRLRTLRSHTSLRFPELLYAGQDGYRENFDNIVNPILDAIPKNREESSRKRLIKGYFDDMLRTLENNKHLLSEDGYLIFVVGNSLHGTRGEHLLIAADLVIARLAEIVGFKVESFTIARHLKRRYLDSHYMRESVVFLKKERKTKTVTGEK